MKRNGWRKVLALLIGFAAAFTMMSSALTPEEEEFGPDWAMTEPAAAEAAAEVRSAYVITVQPVSVTAAPGNLAAFHVEAVGDDLTYRWQYKTPNGTWKNSTSLTEGYNENTLRVEATMTRSGYQYRCMVTNDADMTLTSDAATLTVSASAPLAIIGHPADVFAGEGDTAVFRVDAVGSGLCYQWQYKTPTGTWKNSSSATPGYNEAILRVEATERRSGYQYHCIVTDASGETLISNAAALIVGESEFIPITITQQPRDCFVNALGETAAASVAAEGGTLSYQWYYKDPSSGVFKISTNKTNTYSVTMTAARKGRQIYCEITNTSGASVTTETVILSALPTAVITVPLLPAQIKKDNVSIQVSVSGDDLTYTWYYRETNLEYWYRDSSTTDTYQMTVNQGNTGRQVLCVVSDRYGNTIRTNAVTVIRSGNIVLPEIP